MYNAEQTFSIEANWEKVKHFMKTRFDRDGDLRAVLFVIGLRELGTKKRKFSKEDKQDLMNLATCQILRPDGYFEVKHLDKDGWPVWHQIKAFPPMNNAEQELFIKSYVIRYLEEDKLL